VTAREDEFSAVLDAAPGVDPKRLLAFAQENERALLLAGCAPADARRLATVRLVTELLLDAAGREGGTPSLSAVFARAAEVGGLPEISLRILSGRQALRDSSTALSEPRRAILLQLRTAAAIAPFRELSLWTADSAGHLERIADLDGQAPAEATARVARRVFDEAKATPPGRGRELVGVPVTRRALTVGALAGRTSRGDAAMALMALEMGVPPISLVLEREALLESADLHGAEAVKAAERALVRFGFDVHDGPAQGVAGLQADIRMLRRQVLEALADDGRAELIVGRLSDLEARSSLLADQIRGLARSASSPAALEEPVEEVLRGELQALRESTRIETKLDVFGPVDAATDSQRIALLRGIQEALRNVREHSGAREVRVWVAAGADRTEAEVRDDGRGFDLRRVRLDARRGGHMGLAGIAERVQLLGGECEIRSRPGGPTTIRMLLPRWEPLRAS
jgi:signal transduction histidine kinase